MKQYFEEQRPIGFPAEEGAQRHVATLSHAFARLPGETVAQCGTTPSKSRRWRNAVNEARRRRRLQSTVS